jgi:hypothetical protein
VGESGPGRSIAQARQISHLHVSELRPDMIL